MEATDPFLTENSSADSDKYEDFPEDDDHDVQNPQVALSIAKEIREIGNKRFKEGNARDALLKYQSTCFFICGCHLAIAEERLHRISQIP